MIHVCYAIYDKYGRYSKFVGISMVSLFENISYPISSSITVHILHDNTLTLENRDKFNFLAGKYNQIVKFYNVEKTCKEQIEEFEKLMPKIANSHYSIATMYRLVIPRIFSDLSKVIYLDADTVINLDINELWKIDIGNAPLAAVPEHLNGINSANDFEMCFSGIINAEDYFNAGVEVMNLSAMRFLGKTIKESTIFVATKTRCQYFDQDILNHSFSKKYFKLPLKYNTFVNRARYRNENSIQKNIYHYASEQYTLTPDIFNKLWMEYFVKTAWFNEETISNLYEEFQKIYRQQKKLTVKIIEMMSGKTRVFFVTPSKLESVKKNFHVKPEEKIIVASSSDSLQDLVKLMRTAKKEIIAVLITPEIFPANQILIHEGFKEWEDFINGQKFLSDANGEDLNSYNLVKML